ncbi:cyclophilin-like fold protein [Eisenbergiella sp.]
MIRRNVMSVFGTAAIMLALAGCSQQDGTVTGTVRSGAVSTEAAVTMEAGSTETEPDGGTEDDSNREGNQLLPSGQLVRLTFDGGEAIVRLDDNAAAQDFVSQLPMTQTFEDFNSIEKICRLPEELATEGVESGVDPDIADVTLYVPWNTLVFYYEDYGYNDSLIPMGHVESGMDLLTAMDEDFQVTMELVEETQAEAAQKTEITITAGEQVITAVLEDSATTRAFLETLPRTMTMNEYGGREYYGRMEAITEDGEAVDDFENGDVTFYTAGPSLAIFYAGEGESSLGGLIRMGKITSDLSVFETLGDTVEMQIEVSGQ